MVALGTRYWGSFTYPYRTTTSMLSPDVPSCFDAAIAGHGYMLDLQSGDFTAGTITLVRTQSDTTDSPSEASLSREELWRRAFESWDHGAGQIWRDRRQSDPRRFRSSLGVDVWRRDSLRLLPDTTRTLTSANTNLLLVTTGAYVYVADGSVIRYSTDGTSWTAATGFPASTVLGIASDGSYIYATDGTNIYRSAPGGAFASWNTLDASLLGFVNGRLMAAGYGATQGSLYNIVSASAPTALYAHPDPAWTWTAFAAGPHSIFAAGYVGDKSQIFSIGILSTGAGLDVPLVGLALPDGETVYSLEYYLGFLVVGTSAGLRLVSISPYSTLTVGPTLTAGPPLPVGAVRCVEGQDRWAWFGWTNIDGSHTGLGRAMIVSSIDQSAFIDQLTPAYASDLMAVANGTVTSVATFAGRRMFAVSGNGVWFESTAIVASGTVDTGWVTFGLPDRKVLEFIDLRTEPLDGSVTVSLSGPDGVFVALTPAYNVPDSVSALVLANQKSADRFELRLALTSAAGLGPDLGRVTMLANPAPTRGRVWQLPLLLAERIETRGGVRAMSAQAERDYIALLADSGALITLQVALEALPVLIEDYQWKPNKLYENATDWNGTLLVTAKEPARGDN